MQCGRTQWSRGGEARATGDVTAPLRQAGALRNREIRTRVGTEAATPLGKNPLPSVVHQQVNASGYDRIVVTSDPHGCAEELASLLDREVQVRESDLVIIAGDVVNKGPLSPETLRFARRRGFLCCRGNHDDRSVREFFMRNSGSNGSMEFEPRKVFKWVERLNDDDVHWLSALPFTITLPSLNITVLHAGAVPDIAINEQSLYDLLTLRDLIPPDAAAKDNGSNGYVPCEHPCPDQGSVPWASLWNGPEFIIFGHDARRKRQVHEHAIGIDTGCVYGGELTAIALSASEGMNAGVEYYSVPAQKSWAATGVA